jgi:hypothetical protein
MCGRKPAKFRTSALRKKPLKNRLSAKIPRLKEPNKNARQ